MPDRLALMLDSMMFAVDNGHSFDGIVSIPEIGLEDFGRRPGIVGWLDDGVELLRVAAAAVSSFFHKTHVNTIETPFLNKDRARDSGIGSDDKRSDQDFGTPPRSPALQTSRTSLGPREEDEKDEFQLGPDDRLPRKLDQQVSGNIEHKENEEVHPEETSPRKREEQDSGKLPRKQVDEVTRSCAVEILPRKKGKQASTNDLVGDIAGPHVDQGSSTSPANEEDTNHSLRVEQEKYPRLKGTRNP